MKGWIRLGIVLSGFWMTAVVLIAAGEFAVRDPEACKNAEAFLHVTEFFFSCNPFADLVPGWWNRFMLEFSFKRFLLVGLGPVVVFWVLGAAVYKSWRWVAQGFGK